MSAEPVREIDQFIGGRYVRASSDRSGIVYEPNTGAEQAHLQFSSAADVDAAVASATAAFPAWSAVNPQRRARVMFEFKRLVEANFAELAALLSSEHGKLIDDSKGDLRRGLDVVEFACGIPHLQKGEYTESAGPGIDVYSMRQPLGVCAGITPFNFPAMIPMWMFSIAIACGNTFVLKPSEKDPSVPLRLAELLIEAGAPEGVLNVVHGDKPTVDAILTHPDIMAISFVGSSDVAQHVYATGAAHGKRVQAMGGAKNHGIVMPDADIEQAVRDIIGAAFGSAGQRCMALPVTVTVGQRTADEFVARMKEAVAALKIGVSTDPQANFGPLVTAAQRDRVEHFIQMGIDEGAELLLDGRGFTLAGHEDGFFMGPSLFDRVRTTMQSYQQEIFGPVLQVVRAESFEEAAEIPSRHQYGNGVAIFTRSGRAAREFANRVSAGMVGVNIPIPVPVSYHTFGGWKRSAFGTMNQHGTDGVRFWTRIKTVTQRWPEGAGPDQGFVMPTMG
jgi:malonate-semialdehyde dehydrogenase (acetylating)/methylmalonate-semialdehyde dehydrogenase